MTRAYRRPKHRWRKPSVGSAPLSGVFPPTPWVPRRSTVQTTARPLTEHAKRAPARRRTPGSPFVRGRCQRGSPLWSAGDAENDKSPATRGFRDMRRRGLEPPPGYPGPGPQPGNSTVISVRDVPDRPYRPGARTMRTHRTIWICHGSCHGAAGSRECPHGKAVRDAGTENQPWSLARGMNPYRAGGGRGPRHRRRSPRRRGSVAGGRAARGRERSARRASAGRGARTATTTTS